MLKTIQSCLLIGCLLALVSPALAASPEDTELQYKGIQYACTGVAESKEDPRWKNYSTKLMFTTGGTAYVSDVRVVIFNESGKTVLEAECDTPWLVARLQPGTYQVEITAQKKYHRKVTLKVTSAGQSELAVRFSEISG